MKYTLNFGTVYILPFKEHTAELVTLESL
jgi:hypothetical protein